MLFCCCQLFCNSLDSLVTPGSCSGGAGTCDSVEETKPSSRANWIGAQVSCEEMEIVEVNFPKVNWEEVVAAA